MMKKVMFICLALKSGGAERVINILANEFLNRGFDVTILAFRESSDCYGLDERIHLELHSVADLSWFSKRVERIKLIRKVIREKEIDLAIAFSYYLNMSTVLANVGLKCKVIISERNDPAQEDNKFLLKHIRNILYRFADLLVCQTEEAKAYFPSKVQEKAVVILNPLTNTLPEPFKGEREREIVCYARLNVQKNLPMLINAFAMVYQKHSDYRLKIYGDGEEKEKLIQLVNELNLIGVAEILPFSNDIHHDVLKAGMFVLPSNYEGLSNSMLESLALGLPTICTDCPCGGARMIIDDHWNGLLVPVGDTEKLASAINELIENPTLAKIISRNAVEVRKKLDSQKICDEWINAIKKVCNLSKNLETN